MTFRFLSVTARVNTYSMKRGCRGRRRGSTRESPGEREKEADFGKGIGVQILTWEV